MDNKFIVVPYHDKYVGMTAGYTIFGHGRLEVVNKLLAVAFDRVDNVEPGISDALSTDNQLAP